MFYDICNPLVEIGPHFEECLSHGVFESCIHIQISIERERERVRDISICVVVDTYMNR